MLRRPTFIVIICIYLGLAACSPNIPAVATSLPADPTVPTAPLATSIPAPTQTTLPAVTVTAPLEVNIAPAVFEMPNPAEYQWSPVVNGLSAPVDIQSAGDSSGRLFIVEQAGRIRILIDNRLLDAPFLDITSRVGNNGSEQGLLGLAFHPGFSENGYFFVNYTDKTGNTHVSRFTASENIANPDSEKQILFVQQPYPNHNGGALAFGPDGFLYIGLGDGGSAGDPNGNAQSGNSLLGKILRIDIDHGDPYSIPADNPYAASGEVYRELWAGGLRNPWRFSFDRLTGDLWIGDVGQNQWEEINFIPAGSPGGQNFGWNKMEANHAYNGSEQPEYTAPVAEYPHSPECSVTGGVVYRGASLPAWQGVYFYGDYCSGAIWGMPSPPSGPYPVLFQTGFKISSFGLDESGELFVADYSGSIYRLEKIR